MIPQTQRICVVARIILLHIWGKIRPNPTEAVVFISLDWPASASLDLAQLGLSPSTLPVGVTRTKESRDVPILAWQVTDRRTLDALMKEIARVAGKLSPQGLFMG